MLTMASDSATATVRSERITPRMIYTLVILVLVGIFSFIDRQIITILLEPIKQDIHLSDTEMGLLTGMAFAAVYLFASFPLARWTDRSDRRVVLAFCVALWSLMTAASGFAHVFWQLCAARAGVAAGEAGANPVSQSLVADIFPLHFRAKAMAALTIGPALGIFAGLFLGGWLATAWSWRAAFVIVGAPGLVLSAVIWLTIRDPRAKPTAATFVDEPSLWTKIAILWRIPTFRLAMIGLGFHSVSGYAWTGWAPTFLIRVHGMSLTDIGLWLGLSTASGVILGGVITGAIADRLGANDPRWYGWLPWYGTLAACVLAVLFALTPSPGMSIMLFLPMMAAIATWGAPTYALAQYVVDGRSRALAAAVVGFFSSFLGTGLGPLVVGALNDLLAPHFGQEAIRYSLLLTLPSLFLGGVFYLAASRTAKADFAAAADRRIEEQRQLSRALQQ